MLHAAATGGRTPPPPTTGAGVVWYQKVQPKTHIRSRVVQQRGFFFFYIKLNKFHVHFDRTRSGIGEQSKTTHKLRRQLNSFLVTARLCPHIPTRRSDLCGIRSQRGLCWHRGSYRWFDDGSWSRRWFHDDGGCWCYCGTLDASCWSRGCDVSGPIGASTSDGIKITTFGNRSDTISVGVTFVWREEATRERLVTRQLCVLL